MKKLNAIAKLIGGTKKDAHRFVRTVSQGLSYRATYSQIQFALRKLPPENRNLGETIRALGGDPRKILGKTQEQIRQQQEKTQPNPRGKEVKAQSVESLLNKIESKQPLSNKDLSWLEKNEHFAVLAQHFEQEYRKTACIENALKACNYWKQAGNPDGVEKWADKVYERCNHFVIQALNIERDGLEMVSSYDDGYLEPQRWKVLRRFAINQAKQHCQACGGYAMRFDVRHNSYNQLGNESPDQVIVLCRECHDLIHSTDKLKREPLDSVVEVEMSEAPIPF